MSAFQGVHCEGFYCYSIHLLQIISSTTLCTFCFHLWGLLVHFIFSSPTTQPDIVKLQTVNLAAKLCISNARQSKQLCQYVLNLAKYDQNYDVRDRARFLRQLVLPTEVSIGLI